MGEEQRKSMAEQNGNQKGVLSNIIGNDGQFNMNKMKNMMKIVTASFFFPLWLWALIL